MNVKESRRGARARFDECPSRSTGVRLSSSYRRRTRRRCTYFCIAISLVRLEAMADRVECKARCERRATLSPPVILLLHSLETDETFVVRHVESNVAVQVQG